ncbi:hypothetical protein ACP4OV_008971 [Aristida adscensionis]
MESSIMKLSQKRRQSAERRYEYGLLEGPDLCLRRFHSANSTRKNPGDVRLRPCCDNMNTFCICSSALKTQQPDDVTEPGTWCGSPKITDRCRAMEERKKADQQREQEQQVKHLGPCWRLFKMMADHAMSMLNLQEYGEPTRARKIEKQQ